VTRRQFDAGRKSTGQLTRRIVDLDSLPIPAYDLIPTERYLAVSPELYIAASRGCHYDCAFCCSRTLLGRTVVYRSAASVVHEMELLADKYGVSRFYFYDDNILAWPHLDRLCAALRDGHRLEWNAQARVNDLSLRSIPRLRAAGCNRLSFGFESGSQRIQRYVGKVIAADAPRKVMALTRAGIAVRGYFVIGFPDETVEDIAATARYMLALQSAGMSDVAIFPARPFPGTRLYHDTLRNLSKAEASRVLDFEYASDYLAEDHVDVRARLHRYNTLPVVQVNGRFDPLRVRGMIAALYRVFFASALSSGVSDEELKAFLLAA